MRVFLAGGTGMVGSRIARLLIRRGDLPVILTRSAGRARRNPDLAGADLVEGDPTRPGPWAEALAGCDAAINLVGEGIFERRWSPEVRRLLRSSRVDSTRNLVAALTPLASPPPVLVQASAIGYYGHRGDQVLTESDPPGDDFLARICVEWEAAVDPARDRGIRVPVIRVGVVLDRGSGALGVMAPVFRWVPGGAAPIGNDRSPLLPGTGRQWLSWIHLDDLAELFILALDRPEATGPLNGTAPNPLTNRDFGRELARVLGRPFLPIGPPDAMIRLVLGGVASVILRGQRVVPAGPEALGFRFRHPDLPAALRALYSPAAESASAS